ncbi:hypothetical protein NAEGRDRAFT_47484 [Naegleria gruberi]|uniref:F-box domain-containing protein n=1 Tax=Naegleria gruberi TaxID=5762 RepID=D2V8C5_NAEGR|nr:uncharacterized protein NAEGRDRAFT_47484 [Naegleria gruberi]EFC47156.1 hypothetical protein NAEGRDRAFT_47484 [Naegleria gruberi]|eukprot:XP_002679900.1 hypothetical protein NAEGRDRAFT_47484 [Naegleria gruberi strain NEG-M]
MQMNPPPNIVDQTVILPLDMIFHIMTFIDHLQIIKRFSLVSKDWRQAASRFALNLDFSIHKIHPHKLNLFFNSNANDEEFTETMEDDFEVNWRRNITSLNVSFNYIGNKGVKLLANCADFGQLQHLNLRSNGINFEGINALSKSEFIKNLKSLNLRFNNLGKESFEVLTESENFKNLTELNLYNSTNASSNRPRRAFMMEYRTNDESYQKLVKSPYLKNLKSLNLRYCDIGNAFAIELSNNIEMRNLTTLNLQHNYIGDEGLRHLSTSTHLSNLTNLNLQFNCISVEGSLHIANSPVFSKLRILNLYDNGVNAQIFASPYLGNLEILNVGCSGIGSEKLKILTEKPCYLTNLKVLDLCHNNLDDECLGYIANCPTFASLTYLEVYPTAEWISLNLNILFESPFLKLTNLTKRNRLYVRLPDMSSKLIPQPTMSNLTSICFSCNFELIKDVIESPYLHNLKQLGLGELFTWYSQENNMDLNGRITSITRNPAFLNLTRLNISFCNLNDQDFIEILTSPYLVNLTSLNVSNNKIGDKGMKGFESSALTTKLKILHLSNNQITDEGIQYLASSQPVNLIALSLSENTSLTDTSLKLISQIGCVLTSLRCYKINQITDEGIGYIATSQFMQELQSFTVDGSNISKSGAISVLLNLKLLLRSQKTFFRNVIEKRVPKKKCPSLVKLGSNMLLIEFSLIGSGSNDFVVVGVCCVVSCLLNPISAALNIGLSNSNLKNSFETRKQAAVKGSILATTFTSKQNDTISFLSTIDGNLTRSSTEYGSYIEMYDNIAYNPLSHHAYMYGVSDGMNTLDVWNVDDLTMLHEIVLEGNDAPMDIQYDLSFPGKLVSLSGEGSRFAIVTYDLKSGNKSVLIYLDGIEGIEGNSNAYDSINHKYYVSVSNRNGSNQYYVYNVMQRNLEAKINVPSSLDNAQFDRFGNRLVGTVNEVFTILDLKTGKMTTTNLDLSKIGFRQLGAVAIDSQFYYVFYENHQAQSFFVKINLETLTYQVSNAYNLVGTMLFIPGK